LAPLVRREGRFGNRRKKTTERRKREGSIVALGKNSRKAFAVGRKENSMERRKDLWFWEGGGGKLLAPHVVGFTGHSAIWRALGLLRKNSQKEGQAEIEKRVAICVSIWGKIILGGGKGTLRGGGRKLLQQLPTEKSEWGNIEKTWRSGSIPQVGGKGKGLSGEGGAPGPYREGVPRKC